MRTFINKRKKKDIVAILNNIKDIILILNNIKDIVAILNNIYLHCLIV